MSEPELSAAEWEGIQRSLARLRAGAMAVAFGLAGGVGLGAATVWLVIQGGEPLGPHLALLANYFPGYRVSWSGALVGLCYGALAGAAVGGCIAWLYNRIAERRRALGGS